MKFRIIMSALIVLAAGLGITVAATSPAHGATRAHRNESGFLHESFGAWAAGGSDSSYGAGVLEVGGTGRAMKFQGDGGTWHGMSTGTLVFTALSNKCVGDDTANRTYTLFAHCAGDTGIVWAEVVGNHHKFINRFQSENVGSNQDFSGPGCSSAGCDIRVISEGQSGWLQSWDFTSSIKAQGIFGKNPVNSGLFGAHTTALRIPAKRCNEVYRRTVTFNPDKAHFWFTTNECFWYGQVRIECYDSSAGILFWRTSPEVATVGVRTSASCAGYPGEIAQRRVNPGTGWQRWVTYWNR